ncbi:MAG: nitroreductase family protein [Methanomassiliicoccales archaeon]|nr:MAG: nitroreductase family protein [Methanomassiliicoccales archaeon]
MELIDVIKARRSVRRFRQKKIEDNMIREIIEFGNLAPSAGNLQPRDFVVVKEPDTKKKLARAALDQDFVAEAPVVVVVCANLRRCAPYGTRGRELYCIQDSAAAIENMLLAIVDKGLACCWVGAFDENAVSGILDMPQHIRPMALLPIGYSEVKTGFASRIDLDELIHHERW